MIGNLLTWKTGYFLSMMENELTQIEAGMLDFPRKKLPDEIWLYEAEEPFPRLQPKLRATILAEARYKLKKFGAKLIGLTLYGGAATYQYHKGGDIDCACYIDWEDFKGDKELIMGAFDDVEIPWGDYVIHLFVKPETQQEQIEVADAYYDVLNDEWKLPPYVYPKGFDPEVYFHPLIELAEKKAEKIDLQMGLVSREWSKLKKALEAQKEEPADPEVVNDRIEIQKVVLKDEVDKLTGLFEDVWNARRLMHDELRTKYVKDPKQDRFERFQPAEVTWKYLDEAGYCEFLKVLTKANEAGTVQHLIDQL